MIRNILLLTLILAAAAVYTWQEERHIRTAPAREEIAATITAAENRTAAPDFTFKDLAGKTHNLSDYAGKTIILNFWASWCAPCIIEFPQMLALAERYEKETVFLFLSQDENAQDIARFVAKFPAAKNVKNIVIAQDADKKIAQNLFGTYKLPETYLIAPGLRMDEKIIGLQEWDSRAMREKIKRLTAAP